MNKTQNKNLGADVSIFLDQNTIKLQIRKTIRKSLLYLENQKQNSINSRVKK